MLPYENIQIGNFLIYLGYQIKALDKPISFSFNLLQQTPLDSKAGDLLGGFDNKYFILEFKRDFESIKQESKKSKYQNLVSKLNNNNSLCDISRKCHFLVYGSENINRDLEFKFQTYFTFRENDLQINSVASYLNNLYNFKIGTDYKHFIEYIKLLDTCCKNGSGSNSSLNSSVEDIKGIVVSIDKKGMILSCIFDSLNQLQLSLSLNKEKSINKDRSKGMGM